MSWKSVKLQGKVDPGDDPPRGTTNQLIHRLRLRHLKPPELMETVNLGAKRNFSQLEVRRCLQMWESSETTNVAEALGKSASILASFIKVAQSNLSLTPCPSWLPWKQAQKVHTCFLRKQCLSPSRTRALASCVQRLLGGCLLFS